MSGLIVSETEYQGIVKYRVCARCYGDLRVDLAPERKYRISCPTCGDEWGSATVSRKYAAELGQQALAELHEVKANLRDLFPQQDYGSEAEILKALGF